MNTKRFYQVLATLVFSLVVVAGLLLSLQAAPAFSRPSESAAGVSADAAWPVANPMSVTLVGNLQSELGCPSDWQPECDATKLTYNANSDVWRGTFSVSATVPTTYEYKVALDNSWAENYGAGAQRDGPNIPLALTGTTTVTFYYDHKSHWVTDNENSFIATAPGDFQSELGCPGDWQPECLRSWLQDIDGDGLYIFETAGLPAGSYQAKIALDESWTENYGAGGVRDGPNIPFTIGSSDDILTIEWDSVSKVPTVTVEAGFDPSLVQPAVQHPAQDEVLYFVMPDRFQNGDLTNDLGGLTGISFTHGFEPTHKGFYHGGDLAGLLDKMDYIESLGVTAIWMTPMFKNRPVQGVGTPWPSAGYHGYWIEDFTQFDPHFGTNLELQQVITEAHNRGIKIFFDIITNHTADVIQYAEGDDLPYRNKADYPYKDVNGVEFDDRDYVGRPASEWPVLSTTTSFPYTPVFATITDANIKVPAWLNNPLYYHNRGNTTFQGENSLYGDFFELDDLFTEHPDVVSGMIDIFKTWVEYGVDGFRVDTVKHVNLEFWQEFTPAILDHAEAIGNPDFFIFGEVYATNEYLLSEYTTEGKVPTVLDFRFQSAARSYASAGGASDNLKAFFENDDYFTDADSNVYALPTFIGNHDMGRFGRFLQVDNSGADDAELLARSQLGHALMYFARGVPVIYYGDEQGFTGDGGDQDARQDMFPSQVASYNDDDLIGTISTTAEANFDITHPLYQALGTYADLYKNHKALRRGAQIHRYSTDTAGIYAFSRIDRDDKVEYLVAFNNAETDQQATFATYQAGVGFTAVYTAENATVPTVLASDAQKNVTASVPALSFVIYSADAALPASADAPNITINTLQDGQEVELEVMNLDGNDVLQRIEVGAALDADILAEVIFAVQPSGVTSYTLIGVDNNPPYRVFYDPGEWITSETPLNFMAIVNDLSGHYKVATVTGVVPKLAAEVEAGYSHAVLHYYREDGDYGDHTTGDYNDYWGIHFWGSGVGGSVDWTAPRPFWGEDDYGRFTWITLTDSSMDVGFIVHRGDTKDGTDQDRFFNPNADGPEIWLKNDDPDFYTVQAAAQGYVTIHYHRPAGVYYTDTADYWGLHLWGDAIDPSEGTDWGTPKPPTGIDDFGAYYVVSITTVSAPVNFIVHRGDQKDPGPDQAFDPSQTASVWIMSGDETIYTQRGAAERFVTLHYRRPAGDYGDYSSTDYADFWGMHAWGDAPDPGWTTPHRPVTSDTFGITFKLDLTTDTPQQMGYIFHRGDTKDPGPDQFLDFATYGYEVWQLQGADPEDPYILPFPPGAQPGGDLGRYQAHWLAEDTLAWDVEYNADYNYTLHYASEGGIVLDSGVISGGLEISLAYDPAGLTDTIRAKFPHLADYAVFKIGAADLVSVPQILKGQLAVSARDPNNNDIVMDATGLQIPGVLDDLYTYDGELGVIYDGDVPTLKVWAPTAKNVTLRLFDDSGSTAGRASAEFSAESSEPLSVTLVGNLQAALGCPGDWQPECDATKLAYDADDDVWQGSWAVPSGTWEYKVALDDSWAENYGGGAQPNGPNIPLALTETTTVTFYYDHKSHWVTDNENSYIATAPGDFQDELGCSGDWQPDCLRSWLQDIDGDGVYVFETTGLPAGPYQAKVAVGESWDENYGEGGVRDGANIPFTINSPDDQLTISWDSVSKVPTVTVVIAGFPYTMTYDPDYGVWSVTGDASWTGKFYLYDVEVYVHSTGQVEHNMVTDPYAVSLAMNSTRSQIVNLSDPALKPAGWDTYAKPPMEVPEDIVLYELHVRDFSVNDTSVPTDARGTFKAFTYLDSNGMQHLSDLADAGLTHLHLLPTFDIATINEDKSMWVEPDWSVLASYPPSSTQQQALIAPIRDLDGFNWGYDPFHYSVPEGSYSTNPDGTTRIVEFREMVQALNSAGIRVVMDVVYNHTNAAGQAERSVLDKVVPGYYHRLDGDGNVTTSTCCPNTATEHNMMEKLMIDSVVMWVKQYKVDGFRFDLMGHHMKSNMLKLRAALDALTMAEDGVDGPKVYVYGEGWNFGEVADSARGENATQFNMAGTGIGTFNDRLRDGVRGGGPFDGGDSLVINQGFVNGMYYDPNEMNAAEQWELDELLVSADQIRVGLAANLADYEFVGMAGTVISGSQVDYNGSPAGYNQDPQEHIVYISAHDNQALYDNNQYKMPLSASMTERVRAQNVGLSIVSLAQGVPFFHAGSDMLRSKSMDRNSYNSGDWFNKLDFTYQDNNWGVGLPMASDNQSDWYLMEPRLADPNLKPTSTGIMRSVLHLREMLQIRKSSPLFRLQTAQEVMDQLEFHNTGPNQIPGLIVMSLSDPGHLDPTYNRIVVLFNANDEVQTFTEPSLAGVYLSLHPLQADGYDPVVKTASFDFTTGAFTIPARTTAVFVQKRYGVLLGPAAAAQPGSPGDTVTYTLRLTNTSEVTVTFAFGYTYTGSAWDVTLPADTQLDAGQATDVDVLVRIPPTALAGESNTATVTVSFVGSAWLPGDEARLTTTAEAAEVYGVELAPAMAAITGMAGTRVEYTLRLTNTGTTTDTFTLTYSSTWNVHLPVTQTTLATGAGVDVIVHVDIPAAAALGASDTATITATSQGDPTKSASSELTTAVKPRMIFLPIVMKNA